MTARSVPHEPLIRRAQRARRVVKQRGAIRHGAIQCGAIQCGETPARDVTPPRVATRACAVIRRCGATLCSSDPNELERGTHGDHLCDSDRAPLHGPSAARLEYVDRLSDLRVDCWSLPHVAVSLLLLLIRHG